MTFATALRKTGNPRGVLKRLREPKSRSQEDSFLALHPIVGIRQRVPTKRTGALTLCSNKKSFSYFLRKFFLKRGNSASCSGLCSAA